MVLCQTNSYLNLNCAYTRNICKYFLTCHQASCQFEPSKFIYIQTFQTLSSAPARGQNYSVKGVCQQDLCEGLKLATFFSILKFPFNYVVVLSKHYFRKSYIYIKNKLVSFSKDRKKSSLFRIDIFKNLEKKSNCLVKRHVIISCPFS